MCSVIVPLSAGPITRNAFKDTSYSLRDEHLNALSLFIELYPARNFRMPRGKRGEGGGKDLFATARTVFIVCRTS